MHPPIRPSLHLAVWVRRIPSSQAENTCLPVIIPLLLPACLFTHVIYQDKELPRLLHPSRALRVSSNRSELLPGVGVSG